MANQSYKIVMSWLGVYEGGKVDDPKDPGGRTNRGVIQRVYNGFRRANRLALRDVYLMTNDEHDAIYLEQYWNPIWGDRLPVGVDAAMFDYGVNSGVSRSVKVTQRIVGVTDDGVMGNVTMAAIMDFTDEKSAAELCVDICEERMRFLRRLKHWKRFKGGWTRRVVGDNPGVQDGDVGVLDRSVMLTRNRTPAAIPAPKMAAPGKAPEDMMGSAGIILGIIFSLFGVRSIA